MSEEPTDTFEGATPFERRVLRELLALNQRLVTLEETVDARLHETRPIWEAVLARLQIVDSKLDVLAHDLLESRAEVEVLKKYFPPAA